MSDAAQLSPFYSVQHPIPQTGAAQSGKFSQTCPGSSRQQSVKLVTLSQFCQLGDWMKRENFSWGRTVLRSSWVGMWRSSSLLWTP